MPTFDVTLHLATPCYGGAAHVVYMQGLLALEAACAERGVGLHMELGGGEALISRGRGSAMAQFIAGRASHLLFIDADIGFAPDAVFRLVAAEKEVIGGVYARKVLDRGGQAAPLELELLAGAAPPAPDAPFRVASVGTGFLLIRRAAAERLSTAYPALRGRMGDVTAASVDQAVMVFDSFVEPETGRYLADHQAFCRRWRDIGGEVWAQGGLGLRHMGELAYVTAG
ncbi:MAG: hypothetical protein JWQ97_391 [Phenylobacterium sp.]|nr:hypothetical protein [Phenylobacterium sp.]